MFAILYGFKPTLVMDVVGRRQEEGYVLLEADSFDGSDELYTASWRRYPGINCIYELPSQIPSR